MESSMEFPLDKKRENGGLAPVFLFRVRIGTRRGSHDEFHFSRVELSPRRSTKCPLFTPTLGVVINHGSTRVLGRERTHKAFQYT